MDAAKAFASVDDVQAVCPSYSETQRDRAEKLLALVSAFLRQKCDWQNIDGDVLKLVTCQVISRVLQVGSETPIGAKSEMWQAAPFMNSVSYANPTGDIYLTSFEKDLLGIGGCTVTVVNQPLA